MVSIHRKGALILGSALVLLTAIPALAGSYREEFHKTYPAANDVHLSLNNVNGDVEITVWDRNEVQLDAVKTANTEEKLKEAEIRVEASQSDIHIETHYPSHWNNNNPASVAYELHVPRNSRLDKIDLVNGNLQIDGVKGEVRASSVNGAVTARGLSGNVELSTVNGAIRGELLDLASARRVKLSSVNGHVEIAMPKDANAHLSASTLNGSISSDIQLTVHHGFVGQDLDTTLGSGATRVELSNVNGGIKIHGGNAGI